MPRCILIVLASGFLAWQSEPWKATLGAITGQRDQLSQSLDQVLTDLRLLVQAERPDLLPKLAPPTPQVYGYGLLPELVTDAAEVDRLPASEKRYDMVALAAWVGRDRRLAIELARRVKAEGEDVEDLVQSYQIRMVNFRRIESHISYHALWQKEVHSKTKSWDRKQRLMDLFQSWQAGEANEAQAAELEAEFLQFYPKQDLKIDAAGHGRRVLRITIATDIEHPPFLKAFREGIERFWNQAEAMKEAGLSIVLEWDQRRPQELYPEGPPERGSSIDKNDHLARFGPKAFVLTTGAKSTHVWGSYGIFVGTARTSPHTLAHEFAHLLGFADRYLRAYERLPGDPKGVALVEVVPFRDDMMASPDRGKVTTRMVKQLLDAYATSPPAQTSHQ